MHDGAPPLFSGAARGFLSNTRHDRWTCTAWPPRSPGLNPLDSYLWGHLNTFVRAASVDNEGHCTIALWMPVRLSATASASLYG
jgi:hypothetical protein